MKKARNIHCAAISKAKANTIRAISRAESEHRRDVLSALRNENRQLSGIVSRFEAIGSNFVYHDVSGLFQRADYSIKHSQDLREISKSKLEEALSAEVSKRLEIEKNATTLFLTQKNRSKMQNTEMLRFKWQKRKKNWKRRQK